MNGVVEQTWLVNDKSVLAALDRQGRENLKLREEIGRMQQAIKDTAADEREYRRMQREQIKAVNAEQQKLGAAAQKVVDQTRTPFERYKQQATELRQHLAEGRIDTDTYRRALSKLAKETKDAANNTDEARAAQARENEELREAGQILRSIQTATEKYDNAVARLNLLKKKGKLTQDQYNRALKQEQQQLRANNATSSGSLKKLAAMAAGYMSIQVAIAAVVAEMRKKAELEKKAAQVERTLEQALADIALNVGGENVGQARSMIEANAAELGVSQQGLANLLGDAISSGAKDLNEALSVVSDSLNVTAGNADTANELVQTSLDLTKYEGNRNFKGAIGQVSQTQSQVRATDAAQFFTNLAPALAAASTNKVNTDRLSTERSLEMSAVVSQLLSDRAGSNTATTIRQFVTRLDSFVPQLVKSEEAQRQFAERKAELEDQRDRGDISKSEFATLLQQEKAALASRTSTLTTEQIDQFRNTRSVDERIEMFRNNAALRQQFLDEQKEGVGKTAVTEIVTGSKLVRELEASAAQAITSMDEATEAYENLQMGVDENTIALRAQRRAEAYREQAATSGDSALAGQARQIVEDTFDDINLPGFDSYKRSVNLHLMDKDIASGESPIQAGIDALAAAARADFWGESDVSREDQQKLFNAINVLADMQREANALAAKQLAAQEEQNRMNANRANAGAAAARKNNQGEN